MRKKIFPQANDLDKVIRVFIYSSTKKNCTKEDIAEFCGFDPRQSDYYTGACFFLDLINEDGTASELGNSILADKSNITDNVYQVIISHPFISKVFSKRLFVSNDEAKIYARELVYAEYPDYSDSVNTRRADAMLRWCNVIIEHLRMKGNL